MALWIDGNGKLHDDMNGTALGLESWTVGKTIATPEQIQAALHPVKSTKQIALEKILELESTITDRRVREAVLGIDNGWLKSVNDQMTNLRTQLV